jgi:predicted secreted protein
MVKTYGQGDQQIQATVGEAVRIELRANPTTGFTWRAIADETMLSVDEGQFQLGGGGIGAGGVQTFTVRSLKQGTTRIRFEYVQPWEGQPAETCEFKFDATAG